MNNIIVKAVACALSYVPEAQSAWLGEAIYMSLLDGQWAHNPQSPASLLLANNEKWNIRWVLYRNKKRKNLYIPRHTQSIHNSVKLQLGEDVKDVPTNSWLPVFFRLNLNIIGGLHGMGSFSCSKWRCYCAGGWSVRYPTISWSVHLLLVSRVCSWSDVYDNLGHFRPSFVHGDVSRGMDEREGAYCCPWKQLWCWFLI